MSRNTMKRRTDVWHERTGRVFMAFLERSTYSNDMRREYDLFYATYVIPLLGPSPVELNRPGPISYVSFNLLSHLQNAHRVLNIFSIDGG